MRYVQWLVDMHSVHYTLEAAVADATTVAATEHYSSACAPQPLGDPVYTLKVAGVGASNAAALEHPAVFLVTTRLCRLVTYKMLLPKEMCLVLEVANTAD